MKRTVPLLVGATKFGRAILLSTLIHPLLADVSLPPIISDHMVLQKGDRAAVWGTAGKDEEIRITLGGCSAEAVAGADGKWHATLDLKASPPGPFEMVIQGRNTLRVSDVVIGQVWLASGQSNMEWPLARDKDATTEIPASANNQIRQFLVTKATSPIPLDSANGTWTVAGPETSGQFSAVGYYFAKALQNQIHQPVGLVNASYGGTPCEAWTSREAMESVPDLKAASERLWAQAERYPMDKAAFVASFERWLRDSGREDKGASNTAAYAGDSVPSEGWRTVKLPGPLAAEGLPPTGVVWLRNSVDIPDGEANFPVTIDYGVLDAFESVYWNGDPVRQYDVKNYPGSGFVRRYDIPGKLVKAGRNVLAIRLFSPVSRVNFSAAPKIESHSVTGPWLAKAECSLPDLDEKERKAAPVAPDSPPFPRNVSSFLYNAMIHPLLPYTIAGAIWYQGESNAGRAWQYRTTFPLMVSDWRKSWGLGDFPFYFCQLANFHPKEPTPGESDLAELREAQSTALKLPNTGQAVLIDIGEAADVHPRNKKEAGDRLARLALARNYGHNLVDSGPVYESMKIQNGRIFLNFSRCDGGLLARPLPDSYDVKSLFHKTAPLVRNSPDSELEGFAICGEDHKWSWADARINGNTVEVWSGLVSAPVAARYGWARNPTVNLYNGAGLPAAPFRTDDFPATSRDLKYK